MSSVIQPAEFPNQLQQINNNQQFITLSEAIARLGVRAGVSIIPYRDPQNLCFSKLTSEIQTKIINSMQSFVEVCEQFTGDGGDLKEEKRLVWFMVQRAGLKGPPDLLELINDDDVIEIQGLEGQLFRSFSYFNYCSYTVDELHSYHFCELYERDPFIEKEMMNSVGKVMTKFEVLIDPIRPHVVKEKFSPRKFEIRHVSQYAVPLRDRVSLVITHFLVTVKAELLNAAAGKSKEDILMENVIRALGAVDEA